MPSSRWPLRVALLTATSTAFALATSAALSVPVGPVSHRLVISDPALPRPVVIHQARPVTPRPPVPQVPAVGVPRRHRPAVPRTTPRQRLDAAVARIPGYRPGEASWVLTTSWGSWGTADWYNARVYISPTVPADRIYDVVAHEWSHLLAVSVYAGDVRTAVDALNRWFGPQGVERAADCMARVLGAQWTHYTQCNDRHGQDGARRLVSRHRLPES